MGSEENDGRTSTTKWDNSLLPARTQASARALSWTFVKSVAFSALVCLLVLGMAELVTQ